MKFKLSGFVSISVYTEVDAETLEEALELAKDRPLMEISRDSFYEDNEYWIADSLDGEVEKVELE